MRIVLTNWETLCAKSMKYNLFSATKIACLFLLFFSWNIQQTYAQQDLSISQIASVDSAGVGDTVTFTITLMNDDTTTGASATGVTVKNILPANMTYVSNNQGALHNLGTVIWAIGGIGDSVVLSEATHSLEIKARIIAQGVHTNQAEVNTMNGFDIDSDPGDGVVTDDDYATACVSVPYKICSTFKDTITLTAPAGYMTYQWLKDGIVLGSETAQTYKAYEVGDYTFNVGCANEEKKIPVFLSYATNRKNRESVQRTN